MNFTPKHPVTFPWPVENGHLVIAGQHANELVRQYGSPLYVYDKAVMAAQVKKLRDIMPEKLHLHYAMKANPMPAVVEFMATLVDGLDVASQLELETAIKACHKPADISFAGPGKRLPELEYAVECGITLNAESFTEIDRLAEIQHRTGKTAQVAIRVNPDFELKASGMKMAGGPKAFGIDAEKVPAAIERIKELGLHFRGFHIFSGSQNLKAEAIIEAHDKTFALAQQLANHAGKVELLNIGGGLGIPYFPGEQRIDLTDIASNLQHLFEQHQPWLNDTEVVMELGRYLVGEAGLYLATIIDIKESRGETFVVTDGGLHHHLAASGNFGQVIRKNYPVCLPDKLDQPCETLVNVVGPLCTPLDVLYGKAELQPPAIGDVVAVCQSGAYGYSASPLGFLSHPVPQQILL